MVPESPASRTEHGLVPAGDGWYVLNLRDAEWRHADGRGAVCVAADDFEGERRALQLGLNVFALAAGEPMAMYHREDEQEDFLVLSGECLLLVEEQERRLRAWDFVHCPAGTNHIFVGAGEGPCAILMVGARRPGRTIHYPVSEVAARHGASAREATGTAREAYAHWDRTYEPERIRWPL